MKIVFYESEKEHLPISNWYPKRSTKITIHELALILEEKYNVVKGFCEAHEDDIIQAIAMELMQEEPKDFVIDNAIKNMWLDYMETEGHGITSVRSRATGTVGLIDTGQYYLHMQPKLEEMFEGIEELLSL